MNTSSILKAENSAPKTYSLSILPLHERPLTFRQAVKALGDDNISYQKLLRAVRAGIIPSYKLHNREYVRLCDILSAMGIEGDYYAS